MTKAIPFSTGSELVDICQSHSTYQTGAYPGYYASFPVLFQQSLGSFYTAFVRISYYKSSTGVVKLEAEWTQLDADGSQATGSARLDTYLSSSTVTWKGIVYVEK